MVVSRSSPLFFFSHYALLSLTIPSSRNPVASQRPSFREILLSLLGTPETVLSIPQEDLETHLLAGMLGSPLEAGENMYCDLQNRYVGTISDDYQEVD